MSVNGLKSLSALQHTNDGYVCGLRSFPSEAAVRRGAHPAQPRRSRPPNNSGYGRYETPCASRGQGLCLKAVVTSRVAACLRLLRRRDGSAGPDEFSSAWLFVSSFFSALIFGADRIRASSPFPFGSHHFGRALDADRLAAKTLSNILVWFTGRDRRPSYWPPLVLSTKTMRATLFGARHPPRSDLNL